MSNNLVFPQSVETVADVMKRPFYMDSRRAKEFGVIDKVSSCHTYSCLLYAFCVPFPDNGFCMLN